MNVLLVYPKYPNTFWSFKYILRFISKKAAFPPLGLMTVASMLPDEWNKRLVDVNISDLKEEDIVWADIVFISAMIIQKENALEIISKCTLHGKKIVAGGPLFTTKHKEFQGVDHFVLNEAEITLPLFLEDLKKGNTRHLYTSEKRPDITKTPAPLWSLIDFRNYASMVVQYSRGCPFNCEFCDIIIMNGRIPRTKSPEQLLNEIQLLYDAGWRGSLFIVDDNFIGNKVRVKKMLPSLIAWQKEHRYPYKLLTEASTNLADDEELMTLMKDANFSKVNGMQVMGGFIVGFDSDTERIFEAQIKFIQQIGVVTAMVGLLNALPQTGLWRRLKSENRLLKDTTGENTDGSLNFVPKMGKKKLVAGYKRILATIYSSEYYYKRIDTFIDNYQPTARGTITMEDIRAFVKSMWRIGIVSESRLRYWRLLFKTLFTKSKAFPVAVELAIYGLHFGKVTRSIVSA